MAYTFSTVSEALPSYSRLKLNVLRFESNRLWVLWTENRNLCLFHFVNSNVSLFTLFFQETYSSCIHSNLTSYHAVAPSTSLRLSAFLGVLFLSLALQPFLGCCDSCSMNFRLIRYFSSLSY